MTAYFDNAATTKVCGGAIDEMTELMRQNYGNPSSSHALGMNAKAALETARVRVSSALGANPGEVFFTSGGTEADNWAILGAAELTRHRGKHIITSASEHDAVRQSCEKLRASGYDITYLNPDHITGCISAEDVENALRDDTVLVSVMLINNETGAENPVKDIASALKKNRNGALLHVDAVQAFCKTRFLPKLLGADLVSVSSHKIHGPKGAGALYIKDSMRFPSLISGGAQEKGYRGGTEALPAIAGFGKASEIAAHCLNESYERVLMLKEHMSNSLLAAIPEIKIISTGEFPYILSISLPGYKSEVLMNYLDAAGICVSKSSACKKGARSHVLEAMGLSHAIIDGAVRISFSRYNTIDECEYLVRTLKEATEKLYKVLGR